MEFSLKYQQLVDVNLTPISRLQDKCLYAAPIIWGSIVRRVANVYENFIITYIYVYITVDNKAINHILAVLRKIIYVY